MARCIQANKVIKRIYRNQIRFVLKCNNKLYSIIKTKTNTFEIIMVKWCPYKGFVHLELRVPDTIIDIANRILNLNEHDAKRYPLNGEWYLATIYSNESHWRLNIKQIKASTITTFRTFFPLIFQLVLALIFAALMAFANLMHTNEWLFAMLPNLDMGVIKSVNLAIEMVGVLALFSFFSEQRTPLSLLFNAFIPLGIVRIVGTIKCYWWMWIVIPIMLIISFFLSAVYTAVIDKCQANRFFIICLKRAFVFLVISLLWLSQLLGISAYTRSAEVVCVEGMTVDEIEDIHHQACQELEKEIWNNLSAQQKLNILQIICDYECVINLGCERVTVTSGITSRETVLGEYLNESRSFVISEYHLMNSDVEEVVSTALHETRHAYQCSLVSMYESVSDHIEDEYKNLYPFKQAQLFADNFSNYYSGGDDYDKYYQQEVERDCRQWSELRINELYIYYIYPGR